MYRLLSMAVAVALAGDVACEPASSEIARNDDDLVAGTVFANDGESDRDVAISAPNRADLEITAAARSDETARAAPIGDGSVTPRRGFPELAIILEDRVSALVEITRIQEELIGFARKDPEAARALRLPMPICEMVLPSPWCSQLSATFRPEPE